MTETIELGEISIAVTRKGIRTSTFLFTRLTSALVFSGHAEQDRINALKLSQRNVGS